MLDRFQGRRRSATDAAELKLLGYPSESVVPALLYDDEPASTAPARPRSSSSSSISSSSSSSVDGEVVSQERERGTSDEGEQDDDEDDYGHEPPVVEIPSSSDRVDAGLESIANNRIEESTLARLVGLVETPCGGLNQPRVSRDDRRLCTVLARIRLVRRLVSERGDDGTRARVDDLVRKLVSEDEYVASRRPPRPTPRDSPSFASLSLTRTTATAPTFRPRASSRPRFETSRFVWTRNERESRDGDLAPEPVTGRRSRRDERRDPTGVVVPKSDMLREATLAPTSAVCDPNSESDSNSNSNSDDARFRSEPGTTTAARLVDPAVPFPLADGLPPRRQLARDVPSSRPIARHPKSCERDAHHPSTLGVGGSRVKRPPGAAAKDDGDDDARRRKQEIEKRLADQKRRSELMHSRIEPRRHQHHHHQRASSVVVVEQHGERKPSCSPPVATFPSSPTLMFEQSRTHSSPRPPPPSRQHFDLLAIAAVGWSGGGSPAAPPRNAAAMIPSSSLAAPLVYPMPVFQPPCPPGPPPPPPPRLEPVVISTRTVVAAAKAIAVSTSPPPPSPLPLPLPRRNLVAVPPPPPSPPPRRRAPDNIVVVANEVRQPRWDEGAFVENISPPPQRPSHVATTTTTTPTRTRTTTRTRLKVVGEPLIKDVTPPAAWSLPHAPSVSGRKTADQER